MSSASEREGKVRVLGQDDAEAWNTYLATRPEATLYPTMHWSAFVAEVFGHRATHLALVSGGRIRGVLPVYEVRLPLLGTKLLSLPFDVGSGGPLADDEASARTLVAACIERARASRASYLQLRCREPLPFAAELGLAASTPLVVTRTQIEDETSLWSRVHRHHRRNVRTAKKRGLSVRPAASSADVRRFHRVYVETFRAFGTPPYPERYFARAWAELAPRGHMHLLVAESGGALVGGMLLFAWNRTLVMKFAVVRKEAVPLRAYAALYAAALRLALEKGLRELSWGSSAPSQSGLIQFKERWAAESRPVVLHDLALRRAPPDLAAYYDAGGLARGVWKRLPLRLTAALGGPLNRWFC